MCLFSIFTFKVLLMFRLSQSFHMTTIECIQELFFVFEDLVRTIDSQQDGKNAIFDCLQLLLFATSKLESDAKKAALCTTASFIESFTNTCIGAHFTIEKAEVEIKVLKFVEMIIFVLL